MRAASPLSTTRRTPIRATRARACGALIAGLAAEGLDSGGLTRLARRAAEADEALERMTDEVEARLDADKPIDAGALFAAPIAIVQRILVRRIAAAGGREPSRIGLEKIEALALRLRGASMRGQALSANVGGAVARLSAGGDSALRRSRRGERAVAAIAGNRRRDR